MPSSFKFEPFEPQQTYRGSLPAMPKPTIGEYGPRSVRVSKSGRWGMGIVTAVTLGIVVFGLYTMAENHQERSLLAAEGYMTEAKITAMSISKGNYRVTYAYTAAGKRFEDTGRVDRGAYAGTEVGDPIRITVARNHPNVSRIGAVTQESTRSAETRDFVLGGVVCLQFGAIFGLLYWNKLRDLRVLGEWPAVTGKILDVRRRSGKHGPRYDMQIAYQTSLGPTEKRFVVTNSRKWTPYEGEYVDVLYNPENPTKSHLRQQLGMAEIAD